MKVKRALSPQSSATRAAGSPPAASTPAPARHAQARSRDSFAPANTAMEKQREMGIHSGGVTTRQHSRTGCGNSAVNQVERSFFSVKTKNLRKYINTLQHTAHQINHSETLKGQLHVNLRNGYAAREMGAVLGMRNVKVVRGFNNYDSGFMSDSIRNGRFGLALVDSNAIFQGRKGGAQDLEAQGQLHWITVDGVDTRKTPGNQADDLYRVRDPLHGTYWVPADNLKRAIDSAREGHGSGGLLVVEKDQVPRDAQQREQLCVENLKHTDVLGKGDGIGSNSRSVADPS